ncbi:hypothetical protein PW52_04275 [Tamlana sedimentorum]|uniref:Secretion system C-terminal sorting domain-containing protein n=1 Tax=Neotamlana sedimentorum TaxID=1435349 RepID=A0A0D7WDT1_9FLAO|nr:hypothetical protein [Tamlana sedimentorum]KJD36853.1 hypothetical protein PW52_04275 [Tamlana sedimentorum]
MKNVIKNTKKGFLMVTMFATLLSFANESANLPVVKDAKKTILTLEGVKAGNLLTILDTNGVVLYEEQITETGNYQKAFDFSKLPNGEYVFELNKDVEVSTIPFQVNNKEVVFNNKLETVIHKPIVRTSKDLVFINKLSLDKAPLQIEVFSGSEGSFELIHTETIENTELIERVFKLKSSSNVNYKFVFTTNGKTFTKVI